MATSGATCGQGQRQRQRQGQGAGQVLGERQRQGRGRGRSRGRVQHRGRGRGRGGGRRRQQQGQTEVPEDRDGGRGQRPGMGCGQGGDVYSSGGCRTGGLASTFGRLVDKASPPGPVRQFSLMQVSFSTASRFDYEQRLMVIGSYVFNCKLVLFPAEVAERQEAPPRLVGW